MIHDSRKGEVIRDVALCFTRSARQTAPQAERAIGEDSKCEVKTDHTLGFIPT
jgi:hypothetical protein